MLELSLKEIHVQLYSIAFYIYKFRLRHCTVSYTLDMARISCFTTNFVFGHVFVSAFPNAKVVLWQHCNFSFCNHLGGTIQYTLLWTLERKTLLKADPLHSLINPYSIKIDLCREDREELVKEGYRLRLRSVQYHHLRQAESRPEKVIPCVLATYMDLVVFFTLLPLVLDIRLGH